MEEQGKRHQSFISVVVRDRRLGTRMRGQEYYRHLLLDSLLRIRVSAHQHRTVCPAGAPRCTVPEEDTSILREKQQSRHKACCECVRRKLSLNISGSPSRNRHRASQFGRSADTPKTPVNITVYPVSCSNAVGRSEKQLMQRSALSNFAKRQIAQRIRLIRSSHGPRMQRRNSPDQLRQGRQTFYPAAGKAPSFSEGPYNFVGSRRGSMMYRSMQGGEARTPERRATTRAEARRRNFIQNSVIVEPQFEFSRSSTRERRVTNKVRRSAALRDRYSVRTRGKSLVSNVAFTTMVPSEEQL